MRGALRPKLEYAGAISQELAHIPAARVFHMKRLIFLPTLAALGLLCACAHYGTIPAPSSLQGPSSITGESLSPQTIIRLGSFTEYTLPSNLYPTELTHGPYSTLWFVPSFPGVVQPPAAAVQFSDSSGATHIFEAGTAPTNPPKYLYYSLPGIISVGGAIYYTAAIDTGTTFDTWAIRVTPQGADTYKDLGITGIPPVTITNFTVGADGNLWYAYFMNGGVVTEISPSSFAASAASSVTVHLSSGWCPNWVQSGPLNRIYATARYCGGAPYPTHDSLLYVITTAGTIVCKFVLANNSFPQRLATGSDRNLWVLEPNVNKIARVTPTGVVTQFSVPTPGATLVGITPGADGALWFTEYSGNKIGRITTSGHFTEYSLPNPNSGPGGIVTCTTNCPPHGGVWFTEFNTNRIGKFVSPL